MKLLLLFFTLLGLCPSPANAATFIKKLKGRKAVLQLDDDEVGQCCKKGATINVSTDDDEIGDFKALRFSKKKKRVVLKVGKAIKKFKKGVTYTLDFGDTDEDDAEDQEEPTAKAATPVPPKMEFNGPSEAVREGKKYWLHIGGGNVVGGASGVDIEAAYMLSRNGHIGLSIANGTVSPGGLSDSQFTATLAATATMITAKWRHFFGNSFNMSGFLGTRLIDTESTIESRTSSDKLTVKTSSQSIVLGISLGNHWAWDNGFTLGCDWIGYALPISSSVSSSVETTGTISSAQQQFADLAAGLAEDLGTAGTGQLLILTLGVMF